MLNTLTGLTQWPFLNEPIYRWFIFLIVLSLFGVAWRGVLDHMK